MKLADGTFAAPPRRFAISRWKGVPLQGPLAKSSRFPAPGKWLDRRDGCTPALV